MDNVGSDAIPCGCCRDWPYPCLHSVSASSPPEACSTNQQPGSVYASSTRSTDPSGGYSYGIIMTEGQPVLYQVPALPQPVFPTPYHPGIFTPTPSFSFRPYQQCPTNMIPVPQAVDHYSQVYPVINGHPTYDVWTEYEDVSPVFPGQHDSQAVPGSVSPMGYMQPPYVPPALQDIAFEPASERSISRWPCPICTSSFRRWQDQERHILSHLPQWIYCPNPDCSWRGDRPDAFKKHWCADHPSSSQEPDKQGYTIYDPEPLIEGILDGSIPIEEAQRRAVSEVKRRAQELDKSALWDDCWGRKGKKAGRFEGSRK